MDAAFVVKAKRRAWAATAAGIVLAQSVGVWELLRSGGPFDAHQTRLLLVMGATRSIGRSSGDDEAPRCSAD